MARLTLIRTVDDLATFDAVFASLVEASTTSSAVSGQTRTPGGTAAGDGSDGELPWATLPTPRLDEGEAASGPVLPHRLPSLVEALADVPFEQLDQADLADLGHWMAGAFHTWPTRRSRRLRPGASSGTVTLRETLHRARRTGGEPVRLVRARPVRRPRRLVMLADVSQSMQPYATAYLHLMRAAVRATDAEVFAFATGLTRLTPVLRHHRPEHAVAQASERVGDRFGGTRIATSLHRLLRSRHGSALRGAVVVIASDGWDGDEPAALAAEMARLRRRAHRVVWMNPRAAAPGFRPEVGAMAAALPYCDELRPAHTLRAMVDVLAALRD